MQLCLTAAVSHRSCVSPQLCLTAVHLAELPELLLDSQQEEVLQKGLLLLLLLHSQELQVVLLQPQERASCSQRTANQNQPEDSQSEPANQDQPIRTSQSEPANQNQPIRTS
uniref:Uncharacterized protein n=1 Tax=Knipowitschia caucasica TaxID=637954 RepID=A0AAV2K851_KNICA